MTRTTFHWLLALLSLSLLMYVVIDVHIKWLNADRTVTVSIPVLSPQQLTDIRNRNEMVKWQDHLEINCIALALYGEARGSVVDDQRGVAHAIVNRRYSLRYPNNACDVVIEPWQFESVHKIGWLNDMVKQTMNGSPTLPNNHPVLEQLLYQFAHAAYYGLEDDPTKGALYFWSPRAQYRLGRAAPNWSREFTNVANLGEHKYYVR